MRSSLVGLCTLAASASFAPRTAFGQTHDAERFYGGAVIINDASSVALGLFARRVAPPLLVVPAALFVVGPPVIHLAHGERRSAVVSAALRVTLPVVGLGVGHLADRSEPEGDRPRVGLLVGLGAGIVTASVLDVALLAWTIPKPAPAIAPTVAWTPERWTVGLGGAF
jgi:hypothetical protein